MPTIKTATVAKEDLLRSLDEVSPGLSPKEILEQSSCFAFVGGKVMTFNEEVSCRCKSGLPEDLTAVVQAGPLLALLRKVRDPKIEVALDGGEFVVKGKGKETRLRMEAEVKLQFDLVEMPKEWQPLNPDFGDAVSIVQECAGKDESTVYVNVHVKPDCVEATDNYQMTRYKIKTGLKEAVLVRKDSLRHVVGRDLTKLSETKNWIHFKGPTGLVMSCRRYEGKFPSLDKGLAITGEKAVLPKALVEAVETAEIFSAENGDKNEVMVEIRPGKMRIVGVGASGKHTEYKKLKYQGRTMKFTVSPKLLAEIVKRHTDCELSDDHFLKIDGGKFTYVVSLDRLED